MSKRIVGTEAFDTAPRLARTCVDFADRLLTLADYPQIIEPSAGSGSFLDLLPGARGLDIEPRADGIEQADFLTWKPPQAPVRTLVIGNPPFGQRGSLAMRFIEKSCSFADAFAFVLPRSFAKYTFTDRIDPLFHLLGSFDCDEFSLEGQTRRVNTSFQVWRRGEGPRPIQEREKTHPHFEMRHAHLSRVTGEQVQRLRTDYAFCLPQVGGRFRPADPGSITRGSHWFIKPLVAGVRERFEAMDFSFLDGMNLAHASLGKADIISAYMQVLHEQQAVRGPESGTR